MKYVPALLLLSAFFIPLNNGAVALSLSKTYSNTSENCSDSKYRQSHPDKCQSFVGSVSIPLLSGATVIGGALALIGMANASSDTAQNVQQSQTQQPTLPTYNMVGGDIDSIQLSAIESHPEYELNFNQYNEIRLSYSLARGYTGRGSTIAVLDSGLDSWHGAAVTAIASGPIAPNAIVKSYKIADNNEFVSYKEIGNAIASANDANIYNASWSVPMRATDLHSRNQLIKLTDKNFVNQISIAATERDAIFVWAAGNDSDTQSSALSALPNVMPELNGHFINVVAWDNETGTLADYSNACGITANWCITAPGTDINTGGHISASGTSFATPIVSAAVAVIREAFPYMNATEITSLLFETARDIGAVGVDSVYGHGMLDLERATRPVGAPLVPMDNGVMHPLEDTRVSGTIAMNIKQANPQFAFFDKYGRAFNTSLSNIISVQNIGLGFQRLRQNTDISVANIGNFEMGFKNSDIMFGQGLLQSNGNDLFSFIGMQNTTDIGGIQLFQRARLSFGTPRVNKNSLINNFSNIYMASVDMGIKYQDWSFGISIPDTIVDGTMNLRLPVDRADNGNILYHTYAIDMRGRPSLEYSISYKSICAGFVDNPYGTDEFYILARGRTVF